jgi:hypothetical protein
MSNGSDTVRKPGIRRPAARTRSVRPDNPIPVRLGWRGVRNEGFHLNLRPNRGHKWSRAAHSQTAYGSHPDAVFLAHRKRSARHESGPGSQDREIFADRRQNAGVCRRRSAKASWMNTSKRPAWAPSSGSPLFPAARGDRDRHAYGPARSRSAWVLTYTFARIGAVVNLKVQGSGLRTLIQQNIVDKLTLLNGHNSPIASSSDCRPGTG